MRSILDRVQAPSMNSMHDEATIDTTLGILAGGRATRLGGTDKAWLRRDGVPQVVRISYTPKDSEVLLDVAVNVTPPSANRDERYLAHIRNAGFGGPEDDAPTLVSRFQAADRKLKLTGRLDDPTRAAIDAMVAGTLAETIGRNDG